MWKNHPNQMINLELMKWLDTDFFTRPAIACGSTIPMRKYTKTLEGKKTGPSEKVMIAKNLVPYHT